MKALIAFAAILTIAGGAVAETPHKFKLNTKYVCVSETMGGYSPHNNMPFNWTDTDLKSFTLSLAKCVYDCPSLGESIDMRVQWEAEPETDGKLNYEYLGGYSDDRVFSVRGSEKVVRLNEHSVGLTMTLLSKTTKFNMPAAFILTASCFEAN